MVKDKTDKKGAEPLHPPQPDGFRELVETLAIAIILAFLVRTFLIEAFVIPTGSMAPTLLGRHAEVDCPLCGTNFQVGISERHNGALWACTCPNCRIDVGFKKGDEVVAPDRLDGQPPPTQYSGDRITVSKFPYMLGNPERWDVAVFKYPNRAHTNYIKRIVGMPGETLRIDHGDVYTAREGKGFEIERKPPEKVLAMLQMVYDNDHCVPVDLAPGVQPRWRPAEPVVAGSWESSRDGHSFSASGAAADDAWLRYEHRPLEGRPSRRDEVAQGEPKLIDDFYAYDWTGDFLESYPQNEQWVGDLALECELTVQDSQGEAALELVKGGRAFQCRFDLKTGRATFGCDALPDWKPSAETSLRGAGTHRILLANVDQRLLLWIDHKLVELDGRYDLPWTDATVRDTVPAGIAVRGVAAQVHHLQLLRDVYYTAHTLNDRSGRSAPSLDYVLADGQYLALGDNSPKSSDSRFWNVLDERKQIEHYVRRELFVGKAMFVYWPHALVYMGVPLGKYAFEIPVVPNFPRMRFVH